MAFRDVDHRGERGDVAVHAVHAFEHEGGRRSPRRGPRAGSARALLDDGDVRQRRVDGREEQVEDLGGPRAQLVAGELPRGQHRLQRAGAEAVGVEGGERGGGGWFMSRDAAQPLYRAENRTLRGRRRAARLTNAAALRGGCTTASTARSR